MLFSIVVPTYNRAQLIVNTINSVLAQTYPHFELIIVDDGSTDNTSDIVSRFQNKKISYYYKKNEERSIARNFGAEKAAGDFIFFLDSDDILHEDHLKRLHEFLLSQKFEPVCVFTGYKVLNPDGAIAYKASESGVFDWKKLIYGNYLGCGAVAIKRTLFLNHLFHVDPRIIIFEDWELWLRIISEQTIYCYPGETVLVNNHEGRSVLTEEPEKLVEKIRYFAGVIRGRAGIFKDKHAYNTFAMGLYSYAALHVALTKHHRAIAVQLLAKAFSFSPTLVFKRRFFAILKHLL